MNYTVAKIRKLAKKNELEVEHIIEAAFTRDESIASELQSLRSHYNWPDSKFVDGSHVVPLGKWVRFACIFISQGYRGLIDNYNGVEDFSLSFLESYKTTDSIEAIYEIAKNMSDSATREVKHDIAAAINLQLSFNNGLDIDDNTLNGLKLILHSYLVPDIDDTAKAIIYYALRGVGDLESIDYIKEQSPLEEPWETTASVSIKAIKKRMKLKNRNYKSLQYAAVLKAKTITQRTVVEQ